MANGFSKSEMIFFEDVLAGFDPNNITARNCKVYEPNMTAVERSGLTVRRPIPYIAEITSGLDVSAQYKDMTELTVPSTLAESNIKNHAFTLNALELNDATRRQRAAKAAAQGLAAKIDTEVSDRVAQYGSLVTTRTGDFTSYDDLAAGETQLMEREIPSTYERALVLNPRMARKMANELASRATDNSRDMDAYMRSKLPMVGSFETLKANVLTSITGAANPTVTINGAGQYKTPTVFDGTNSTAADNRFQTITVTNTSGSMANGDAFTIAGVYALGMVSKKSTGQLQTFRVVSGGGTTSLTITPAIIPLDVAGDAFQSYANVNTAPATGAAITRLNTASAQPSIHFCKDAVEIFHGRLAVDELGPNVSIMREVTDSGIEVIFARQGAINDLSAKYRLTCWTSVNVLEPQMCGIYLPNQAASFN